MAGRLPGRYGDILRILITAGAGFVGANLLRHFLDSGYDTIGLARKSSNRWRLAGIKDDRIVTGDITDREGIMRLVKRIGADVVIHTAMYGGYPYEKDDSTIYSTNLQGTMNVFDASAEAGARLFINTGSSSEYGLKAHPMKESDLLEPYTDYGISKALATQYCRYKSIRGMKVITIRPFSVYGYFEEQKRLMSYLIYSAIKRRMAKISSLSNVRDYVFIDDVVSAYDAVLARSKRLESGSVFNIGSGTEYSIADVVGILGVDVEVDDSVRAPESVAMWKADIAEAKRKLGWTPRNGLRQGIMKTRRWMKKNLHYYQDDAYDRSKGA